jgi:hypothetical protein
MKAAIAAATALGILCWSTIAALAKTIVLATGIGGTLVAPLNDYEAELKRRGHTVVRATWLYMPPVKPDYVISHSAAADIAAQTYPKAKHFTLDSTILNRGCPKGTQCDDYYGPVNKLPFLICCGGYALRGQTKQHPQPGTLSFFIFAPGHVGLPSRVRADVIGRIK